MIRTSRDAVGKDETVKMASLEYRIGSDGHEKSSRYYYKYSEMETTLKKKKKKKKNARAKSNFTRARNKEQEFPFRRAVQDASSSLENWLETALETIAS